MIVKKTPGPQVARRSSTDVEIVRSQEEHRATGGNASNRHPSLDFYDCGGRDRPSRRGRHEDDLHDLTGSVVFD